MLGKHRNGISLGGAEGQNWPGSGELGKGRENYGTPDMPPPPPSGPVAMNGSSRPPGVLLPQSWATWLGAAVGPLLLAGVWCWARRWVAPSFSR